MLARVRSLKATHVGLGAVLLVIVARVLLGVGRALTIVMWSDEYHSVRLMRLPLGQLATGQYAHELNPPLYYLLLHLTVGVVGETEVAMRLFSIVFGVASLVVYYLLVREMLPSRSPATAIAGLIVLAFHPLYLYYSTEIRGYVLLLFFTLLSFLSYFKVVRGNRRQAFWGLLLVLSLVAAPYTHHFGLLTFVSVLLFAGVHLLFKRAVRAQLMVLAAVALAAVLYLPGALTILYRQGQNYPVSGTLFSPIEFLQIFTFSIHQPAYEPVLAAVALLAFAAGLIRLILRPDSRVAGVALALILAGTVSATLLAYSLDINIVPRYIMHIAPLAFVPIAANVAAERSRWAGRLLCGLSLVTVALYGFYGLDFTLKSAEESALAGWKADWKKVSATVRNVRTEAEPVVMTAWDNTPLLFYLDGPVLSLAELREELAQSPRPSYLVVVSQNTRPFPLLDEATLLYENRLESVQIRRLRPLQQPSAGAAR